MINNSKMKKLDLNKIPKVPKVASILHFDPFKEFPKLRGLKNTSERIHGCITFISYCSGGKHVDLLTKAAFFRACLNEFASISEMLKVELPQLTIEKQDNPLFHFLKELRVTNYHLKSFKVNQEKIEFSIVNSTNETKSETKDEFKFDLEIFTISDCDKMLFESNNNYNRFYSTTEFTETIKWVSDNQMSFGIWFIVELALRQYCELINNSV